MIYRKYFTAFAAMLICPAVMSDSFQYELSVGHVQTETDNDPFPESELDTTRVEGTYYLTPVDVSDGPLSEAAFLSRTSSVSVGYEHIDSRVGLFLSEPLPFPTAAFTADIDVSLVDAPLNTLIGTALSPVDGFLPLPGFSNSDTDEDVFSISGEYITQTGWIAGLDYSMSSDDQSVAFGNARSTSSFDRDILALTIGKYVGPSTTASFTYSEANNNNSSSLTFVVPDSVAGLPFAPINSMFQDDGNTEGYTVSAKTLLTQGAYTHSLEAEFGYDVLQISGFNAFGENPLIPFFDKSYARRWGVDYAFFPRNDLKLGVGYRRLDPESLGKDVLNLSVEWFVKPRVAVRAEYINEDLDNIPLKSNALGIAIKGRF